MSWIKELFGLCNHDWKVFREVSLTREGYAYGFEYHMRCSRCGEIKAKTIKHGE